MTKAIHRQWENRFVLQQHGAMRKFYRLIYYLAVEPALVQRTNRMLHSSQSEL